MMSDFDVEMEAMNIQILVSVEIANYVWMNWIIFRMFYLVFIIEKEKKMEIFRDSNYIGAEKEGSVLNTPLSEK